MAQIAGYLGTVQGQTGVSAAFTNQPCTDISPATALRTQYRITDSTKRSFDPAVVPTVQTSPDGTTWTTQSPTLYTIQYAGGAVVFGATQASGTQVRFSAGNAFPMAAFAGATKWSGDFEVKLEDVTTLGVAGGAKVFQPTTITGKISLEGYWVDSYFFAKLVAGATCVVALYTGDGGHYDCYALASKVSPDDSVGGLINEKRELQITGQFYWYAS